MGALTVISIIFFSALAIGPCQCSILAPTCKRHEMKLNLTALGYEGAGVQDIGVCIGKCDWDEGMDLNQPTFKYERPKYYYRQESSVPVFRCAPASYKRLVLRKNGIRRAYYALKIDQCLCI